MGAEAGDEEGATAGVVGRLGVREGMGVELEAREGVGLGVVIETPIAARGVLGGGVMVTSRITRRVTRVCTTWDDSACLSLLKGCNNSNSTTEAMVRPSTRASQRRF